MTEPVFFVIAMGAVCLLAIATAPGMHGWIPLAGILVGLSILARYSGLALLAAGFVFILLFRRGSVRTWTLGAVLFVLLASLPLAVWLALAPSNGEPLLGGLIPTGAEVWSRLAPVRLEVTRYVWNWLPFTEYLSVVSHRARLAVTIAVFAVAVGLFIATDLRRRHLGLGGLSSSISGRAVSLLVLFALSYVALLAGAFIFRDAQPDLIGRTLLPISLGLSGAAFALIWFIGETWLGGRWAVWALAGIGAIVAVRGASPTLELVSSLHANGGGYTSAHWQDSGAIRGLREINPDLAIVTNEAAAVQLYTGRSPYNLLELGPLTSPPDQAGVGDVRSLAIPALPRGEGALVLFDSIYGQWLTVNEAETRARVEALTQGMTVYSDYWDGTIYLYPPE